jgi:hypothetical protein
VALGDHLRAYQNVVGRLAKALQDGFVLALGGDRVAIPARDPRFGLVLLKPRKILFSRRRGMPLHDPLDRTPGFMQAAGDSGDGLAGASPPGRTSP